MTNQSNYRTSPTTNATMLDFAEWQRLLAAGIPPHQQSAPPLPPLPAQMPGQVPQVPTQMHRPSLNLYRATLRPPPLPIHSLFLDSLSLHESELVTFYPPAQLPPLAWVEQPPQATNESYVSMLLHPPLAPPLQLPPPPPSQPLQSTDSMVTLQPPPLRINTPVPSSYATPRRSARISATSLNLAASSPFSMTSIANQTSDDEQELDDEEDEDEDGEEYSGEDDDNNNNDSGIHAGKSTANPVEKTEKRREQVRRASKTRRDKLKEEEVFVRDRLEELEIHKKIMELRYPLP